MQLNDICVHINALGRHIRALLYIDVNNNHTHIY